MEAPKSTPIFHSARRKARQIGSRFDRQGALQTHGRECRSAFYGGTSVDGLPLRRYDSPALQIVCPTIHDELTGPFADNVFGVFFRSKRISINNPTKEMLRIKVDWLETEKSWIRF